MVVDQSQSFYDKPALFGKGAEDIHKVSPAVREAVKEENEQDFRYVPRECTAHEQRGGKVRGPLAQQLLEVLTGMLSAGKKAGDGFILYSGDDGGCEHALSFRVLLLYFFYQRKDFYFGVVVVEKLAL